MFTYHTTVLLILLFWVPAAINSCTSNNGGCGRFSTCTSSGPGTNTCNCFTNYVSTARPRDGTKCAGLCSTVIEMNIGLRIQEIRKHILKHRSYYAIKITSELCAFLKFNIPKHRFRNVLRMERLLKEYWAIFKM